MLKNWAYRRANQAAGTRVRKAMQDVKKTAQNLRNDIQEAKNKNKK